jgi:hypothetical protein
MDDSMRAAVWSAIRSMLIAVGAWLAGKNLLDSETASALVGSLMVALPALCGVLEKIVAERKAAQREFIAVNVGITTADNTLGKTPLVPASEVPALIKIIAPSLPEAIPNPLAGHT